MLNTEIAVTAFIAQDLRQLQMRANKVRQRGRCGEKPNTGKAVANIAMGKRKRASLCAIAIWARTKDAVVQLSGWRGLRSHIASIAAIRITVMARKICAGSR